MKLRTKRYKPESLQPEPRATCYDCGIVRPIAGFTYVENGLENSPSRPSSKFWKLRRSKAAQVSVRRRCVPPPQTCCPAPLAEAEDSHERVAEDLEALHITPPSLATGSTVSEKACHPSHKPSKSSTPRSTGARFWRSKDPAIQPTEPTSTKTSRKAHYDVEVLHKLLSITLPDASSEEPSEVSTKSTQPAKPAPSEDLLYQLAANGSDHEYAWEIIKGYKDRDDWHTIVQTCWLTAARGGNLRYMRQLERLGNDLDPQTTNSNGDTALHIAAKTGNRDMVRWLIQRGVDLWARNNEGKTAKTCAEEFGHTGCAISLRLAMPGEKLGNKGWWDEFGDDFRDRMGSYDRPLPGGGSDPTPMRRKPWVAASPN
ncbi:ankyrin repeat-containing domain protein [Dactylonectria macrodidyma]|uniref:Ankyrin repeat-containing domain protein n=1 Tax=Dactylonectria macrodidyma TaxID=307937 RepID=A0A9P9JMX7_9HYPO|nr:ankyrin repeat-containing domain protein [Dactylonectria macrodidyma]